VGSAAHNSRRVLDARTGPFPRDGSLLHTVVGNQISLEDVCSMEGFTHRFRIEFAYRDPVVVGKGMATFVMPSRETLLLVFAGRNWTLFWTLGLISKHMHPEAL
jgi:hypothetical protein